MWFVLKSVFLVGMSIIIGILASFGIVPERAIAPSVTPPAVISKTPFSNELADETSSTTNTPDEKEHEASPPTETSGNTAITDADYEKSLHDALNALDALQQAQQNAPTSSTTVDLNEVVRHNVVNIICTTLGGGVLNPISASGVIVHPSGVIITNAHVGQYFLLKDYPRKDSISCVARIGSPAKPAYTLDLLFISPSWVAKNAQKIVEPNPTGNGEHDYALLQITGTVNVDVPRPSPFPYLPLALIAPELNTPVLLAGYPAGFLGGITVQKDLYAASAHAFVQQLYTFDVTTADLFSIGGSIVAQKGSSGGAVAVATEQSPNGAALTGLIVTSSEATDTASRDLRALSTEYIIRDFETERGIPLADYLSHDLSQEKQLFMNSTAPALKNALITVLEQ